MSRSTTSPEFTREEAKLALRNSGMLLKTLRYPITSIEMHYLYESVMPKTELRTWSRYAASPTQNH